MLSEFLFVINDAPNSMMSRELCIFLAQNNVFNDNNNLFVNAKQRFEHIQYNNAIEAALKTRYDKFVFCDSDIRPHMDLLMDFFQSDSDVVGARYEANNVNAWANPEIIHCGFWRTSRKVLEEIGKPYFKWVFNEDQTKVEKCLCTDFCLRATALGFTVSQSGYVMHDEKLGH